MDLFALSRTSSTRSNTQRSKLLFECERCLDLTPTQITGRRTEPRGKIGSLVVFLGHSVNLSDSSLNLGSFPRNLDIDWTKALMLSWVCIGNRCLNCMSHCSRNLRQSRWVVGQVTSRSLDAKRVVAVATYTSSAQVLHLSPSRSVPTVS